MRNETRKLSTVSFLTLLAFTVSCGKQSTANSNDASNAQGSAETRMQQHGDEIMASSQKQEARQWLKNPNHLFFKADAKMVSQFVEDFYNAGATQVLVADMDNEQGVQYCGSILVVLPADSTAREKLFEVGMRADICFGQDPVIDDGQKYLYYTPD
jgi:hypothetical protein